MTRHRRDMARRLLIGIALLVLPGLLIHLWPRPMPGGADGIQASLTVMILRLTGIYFVVLAIVSWRTDRRDRAGARD